MRGGFDIAHQTLLQTSRWKKPTRARNSLLSWPTVQEEREGSQERRHCSHKRKPRRAQATTRVHCRTFLCEPRGEGEGSGLELNTRQTSGLQSPYRPLKNSSYTGRWGGGERLGVVSSNPLGWNSRCLGNGEGGNQASF